MDTRNVSQNLRSEIEQASTTIASLVAKREFDRAEEIATALFQKNPGDLDLKDFYASALYRSNRRIPLAASLALEVYRHRPREMSRLQGTSRCLMLAGRTNEAEQLVREAINDDPSHPDLFIELSYLLTIQGKFDSAKLILDNIVSRYPNHLVAHFHRGWHDIFEGHRVEGLRKQLLGRRIWVWGAHAALPLEANWDGVTPFFADHVYLVAEGGAGDGFMTLGMARKLADRLKKKVILVMKPDFATIANRSIASDRVEIATELPKNPQAPWVGGLEFGKMIENDDSFPVGSYVTPHPERVAKWKPIVEKMKRGRIVGLRWSGDPTHEFEGHRQLPMEALTSFAASKPDMTFVPIYASFEKMEMPVAKNIVRLSESIRDWEDSLAVLSLMDDVVTSCTSVAHASASLGKQTWVLNPIWPYYTWAQESGPSFWYGDHVRVLRQKSYRDWRGPFAELTEKF